tara:strand:+ start:12133 stop:14583 length:2451 start_codon:yes stop_codon:yes gene_type:complete
LADSTEEAAIACRNALFLTDPHVDRECVISTKGTRVAGTCEWITHNESYRAWLNGNGDGDGNGDGNGDGTTRLLWISGGPGKGKTMMSVFLTEELEKHITRADNAELAFFFCSAQDEKRNTAEAVLRGLVHQIIAKRPQLVKYALPYFATTKRTEQTLSSLETLWIIFSRLVADAELGTMFCVLDGLDECEEGTLRVLLARLVSLPAAGAPSSTKGAFKLAIVSRDMPGLHSCPRVRLDPDNDEKVVRDIELFVFARVTELSRIEGFNDDFRASVQTALLARADGTFLWVGFAMHELLQKQTCSEIWEALEDLPSGLPAIYGRMLQRIQAKQREVSRAILRWVTMTVRPLQLQELAAAAGVIVTSSKITVEQATRDAITHCGPLLKVQEQEVSLVHQSARDYLLRKERDSDAVLEAFRLDTEGAHFELARKCLDCIAQSDLQYRTIDLKAELDPRESPLLRYATLHWPEHAKSCSALAAKLFDPYGLFLQTESSVRIHWWETYMKEVRGFEVRCPPSLEMACNLEIIPWVEAVLAKKSWRPRYHKRVDKKDASGRTLLHYAASTGRQAVVQLLVDRGADVKAKDNDGVTVLHSAVVSNEAVVQLLVDRGADVNAKVNCGITVLQFAAKEGNEAVVQLLVDRGADVNAKDTSGFTVLHAAAFSERKNEAVVQLLVDRGADVNAKDNSGLTVLHAAAFSKSENEAVVQLLVDRGADINAKDNSGITVLHWAADKGHKAVVQLLVDRGADVKATDNFGRTVLCRAVFSKNDAVVRLLVDRGADVCKEQNALEVDVNRLFPPVGYFPRLRCGHYKGAGLE